MKHLSLFLFLAFGILLPGCAPLEKCATDAVRTAATCFAVPGGWEEYAACADIDPGDERARTAWEKARDALKKQTG